MPGGLGDSRAAVRTAAFTGAERDRIAGVKGGVIGWLWNATLGVSLLLCLSALVMWGVSLSCRDGVGWARCQDGVSNAATIYAPLQIVARNAVRSRRSDC
jgi:hypothetical protein